MSSIPFESVYCLDKDMCHGNTNVILREGRNEGTALALCVRKREVYVCVCV